MNEAGTQTSRKTTGPAGTQHLTAGQSQYNIVTTNTLHISTKEIPVIVLLIVWTGHTFMINNYGYRQTIEY